MDNYDKALIDQALADKSFKIDDQMWHLLYERKNIQNSLFEFTPENIERLNSINEWLRDIESNAIDHAHRLVTYLKAQQNEAQPFLTDYELDYELQLWASKKFAHLEPLNGNPFFTFHATLPNFKKRVKSKTNPYEWEIDDNPDMLDWIKNENHNEFAFHNQHPLSHQNHCWLFHQMYDHTFLSWQDIIDIEEVWMEVVSRHQHNSIAPCARDSIQIKK